MIKCLIELKSQSAETLEKVNKKNLYAIKKLNTTTDFKSWG